jgi:hypothetical protein
MTPPDHSIRPNKSAKPFWPIVVGWNLAVFVIFLALPFDWKEPVTLVMAGAMVCHLVVHGVTRYAPRARRINELTDEELAMISEARVSAEHDHLNELLDD